MSNAAGALLDNKVYLLGGRESVSPSNLSDSFFVLDLSNKSKGWKRLPGYPGRARENAILVVQNNGVSPCLYLLGGQTETEEGVLSCLTDGYVYNPQLERWSSLGSDFPKGVCAAVVSGANHILLFQKDQGDTLHLKKENALWKYHTITQTLIKSELIPCTYDTMQVLQKGHSFVVIGSNATSGTNRLYSLQGDIVPLEKGLGVINILVIIGYFAVLAGIGIYFSRRQKSTK